MNFVPYVVENGEHGETRHDVFSRLLKDRIIMLTSPIDADVASITIAQLLFLSGQDPERDIKVYLNTPGGEIVSGMAIVDTFNLIPNPIETIAVGYAASMGAVLLAAGTKGKRKALPNSRILIHQPLGGARGQASDIQIQAQEIQRWKEILNEFLAGKTGQPLERIVADTDRDTIFTAQQALEYGLIDQIIGTEQIK